MILHVHAVLVMKMRDITFSDALIMFVFFVVFLNIYYNIEFVNQGYKTEKP